MERKASSIMMLTLLLVSLVTIAINIQPIRSTPDIIIVPDHYSSIQQAINNANEGDTIFVRNGSYGGNVRVNKSLTLIGEGPPPLTMWTWKFPKIYGWVTIAASNVTFRRFQVTLGVFPYTGITVRDVSNVEISQVVTNGDEGGAGIHLANSSNNLIAYSWIYAMPMAPAIYLDESHNNTIVGNWLPSLGSDVGLSVYVSSGNRILHNNFFDNPVQANLVNSVNTTWDDGYPSGGNYWNDYVGVDNYHGPHQNETGSDGIGDTPYVIDENNQDNYPLMKPYYGSDDIGITSMTPTKTVVREGSNLSISVKIVSYGMNIATFNITAYVNTTVIATFTNVTLTSRNSTTITFAWNTNSFAKGNYTITANATQVPVEIDTTDNTCTDVTVLVTILGDVNGDKEVDGKDIALCAKAFGTRIGQAGYIPNADINDDGKIDGKDIAIAAKNFGKRWT